MKKEWAMAAVSVVLTLTAALLILRTLAPGLLGIPVDLQVVGVSEKKPPFFEHVFSEEDLSTGAVMIADPVAGVRFKPMFEGDQLFGQHDLLGFRNHAIPRIADVVTIGDSQTYGYNAPLNLTWPGFLQSHLEETAPTTNYNMSVAGWGAVQYYYAAQKARFFRPRVLVVAYYTGNDALDSFKIAYGYESWSEFIPDTSLDVGDMPQRRLSQREEDGWTVVFTDGSKTLLTPAVRLIANMDHPAVDAGYRIMAETARRIGDAATREGIGLVLTIIPTKELVYAPRIQKEGIEATESYRALIGAETLRFAALRDELMAVPQARYVDLLGPLQESTLAGAVLYPDDNGHPWPLGYAVIGARIAETVRELLPAAPRGLVLLPQDDGTQQAFLINEAGLWQFSDGALIAGNGWDLSQAQVVETRDISRLDYAGTIVSVDPERFGPNAR